MFNYLNRITLGDSKLEAHAERNATEDNGLGGVGRHDGAVVELTEGRIDGDVRRQGRAAVQFDRQAETSSDSRPTGWVGGVAGELPAEVLAVTNVDERNEADGVSDGDAGVSIKIKVPGGVRDVVVGAGSEVDRTQCGGETGAEFVSITHTTKGVEGAHVPVVAIAQGGGHCTDVVLQSGTKLKALEGSVCGTAKGALVAGE